MHTFPVEGPLEVGPSYDHTFEINLNVANLIEVTDVQFSITWYTIHFCLFVCSSCVSGVFVVICGVMSFEMHAWFRCQQPSLFTPLLAVLFVTAHTRARDENVAIDNTVNIGAGAFLAQTPYGVTFDAPNNVMTVEYSTMITGTLAESEAQTTGTYHYPCLDFSSNQNVPLTGETVTVPTGTCTASAVWTRDMVSFFLFFWGGGDGAFYLCVASVSAS